MSIKIPFSHMWVLALFHPLSLTRSEKKKKQNYLPEFSKRTSRSRHWTHRLALFDSHRSSHFHTCGARSQTYKTNPTLINEGLFSLPQKETGSQQHNNYRCKTACRGNTEALPDSQKWGDKNQTMDLTHHTDLICYPKLPTRSQETVKFI